MSERMARCTYFATCGHEMTTERAHELDVAFFQDKSAGSKPAMDSCVICRYTKAAHDRWEGLLMDSVNSGKYPRGVEPHGFAPRTEGWPHDEYYCGCHGWD